MKPNAVVFGAVSIMDISDSTVTPETLGEGVTAYDKSGEKITGTMKSGIDTSDATATAADMAEGVTAYVDGEKITGALPEHLSYNSPINTNYKGPLVRGTEFCIEGYIPEDSVIRKDSVIRNYMPFEMLGDATAEDVAVGKTFTSADGFAVTGTHECEAGLDTSDATATASDMPEGVTAYVNGEKVTGTATCVRGSYSKTVAPTYTTVAGGAVKLIQMRDTIAEPTFFGTTGATGLVLQAETSAFGDATAEDVVAGKTFTSADGFVVTGTHECEAGLDTSDATATASDILSGKTAYVNGEKVTGSIPSLDAMTITPDTEYLYIAKGQYLNGHLTIKGDPNLVSENIKSGVSIFGVPGSLEESSGAQLPDGAIAVQIVKAAEASTQVGSGYSLSITYGDAVEISDSIALGFSGTTKTLSNISTTTDFSVLLGKYIRSGSTTTAKYYYIPDDATFTVGGSTYSKTLTCDKAQAVSMQKVST